MVGVPFDDFDLCPGTSGLSPSAKACADLLLKLLKSRGGTCADHTVTGSVRMNDVWRGSPVGDTHADYIAWHRLLAKDRHSIVCDYKGVERVDPKPGAVSRVRCTSEILNFKAGKRGCPDKSAVV